MVASSLSYALLSISLTFLVIAAWLPVFKTAAVMLDASWLLLLAADYYFSLKPNSISASRKVVDRLSIGRQNEVELTFFNSSNAAVTCRARDDYPPNISADTSQFNFDLPPQAMAIFKYNLLPIRRGTYEFGRINLRYLSMLKLFWFDHKIEAKQTVKVYSDLKGLRDLSIRLSRSSQLGELNQRKRGQGTDFSSLREYAVGDDAKSIDWKATARRDRPVVRTYEVEQEQRLLILLDAGRMMVSDLEGLTRFDHALNAALCLALAGLTRNDQVGIGVFADKPLAYLQPKRGKAQLNHILEKTFSIEPKMVEPDYAAMLSYFAHAQKGRSLIVVLTDLTDPLGSQSLLAGLANLRARHLPFCVTLKDRQVIKLSKRSVEKPVDPKTFGKPGAKMEVDMDAAFERAVAIDLLNHRELSLSVLQRQGCMTLDCPPQELSSRLVETYLEIKKKGRL